MILVGTLFWVPLNLFNYGKMRFNLDNVYIKYYGEFDRQLSGRYMKKAVLYYLSKCMNFVDLDTLEIYDGCLRKSRRERYFVNTDSKELIFFLDVCQIEENKMSRRKILNKLKII